MRKFQHLVLAASLLLLNSTQAFSRQPAVPSVSSSVCNSVSTHVALDTIKTTVISRRGQPEKSRPKLASRHKVLTPISHPMEGLHLHVDATAYALYGRTSTGSQTAPGTIAVDPRLIPYGSRIYVPGYGWGVAADCGGAIQGHIIDLWMPSNSQCYQWGRRGVDIIVQPPFHH